MNSNGNIKKMLNKRRHKKYAGLRQRSKGTFEINYYVNGERVTDTVKANNEAEAYAMRLQLMASAGAPATENKIADISLNGAIEHYLRNTEKILQDNTRQRSQCIYNHLLDFLKEFYSAIISVSQITVEVAKKYKEHLLSMPGKSPSGINTDITKLRAIFKKFEEYGFIAINPFSKVEKIPSRLAKPEKKHLPTDHEIKCILQSVNGHDSYDEITRFLIRVGRRIEETTLYEKNDVLLNEKGKPIKIIVRAEISKTRETGELSLDDELAEIIHQALLKHPEEQYLFG